MFEFNFEKHLPHQDIAVESSVKIFDKLEIISPNGNNKHYLNPELNLREEQFRINILNIQSENNIEVDKNSYSNIIDIMMETGTGKTYTYTKTIFRLNEEYNIFKFIIVVPTLSIKAGTINFLKSESARKHFKEQFNKVINLHIVQSKKNKKITFPKEIKEFVESNIFDKNTIQVMIINAGMINSDTLQRDDFEKNLFDEYFTPFDAISAVKPILIIDEPHKFANTNKTWKNILKMNPQIIFRYGATFPEKELKRKNQITNKIEKIKIKDYHNLIYRLNSVDAFNHNLVKGVIGHITEFEDGKNIIIKFMSSDGNEATFEVIEENKKSIKKIYKKEELTKIHPQMRELFIEKLNKTSVLLSNGLELKKGDKINPYSYSQTLQDIMIQKAVKNHFLIEKQLLQNEIRIKPLTLFFIDNIEEYRGKNGYIKKAVDKYVTIEIKKLLKEELEPSYKKYLQDSLIDISKTRGGYFSQDKKENDESIEKEINEILHKKEELLDLNNARRFIFSKWTLREGWDNPNVFQICKLRSSGSEISKLQEVGRGLRLPVNEYGNRVKDENFYLHYFVDFTENDFIDKLVNEINTKSNAFSLDKNYDKLTNDMIKKISDNYNISEEKLLEFLDRNNVITRSNLFKEKGLDFVKQHYPIIFEGVNTNKCRTSNNKKIKTKVTIRSEKYKELKLFWEKLNQKVILDYKFKNEDQFKSLFVEFLKQQKKYLSLSDIKEKRATITIQNNRATFDEEIYISDSKSINLSTMKYSDFLKQLAVSLNINLVTLHNSFIEANININLYLNISTIRIFKQNFNNFLLSNAMSKFNIEYKNISTSIHPTCFTNKNGVLKKRIESSNIGVLYSDEEVAKNYLFNELFFDSELEKENIITQIKEVIVFTKIPKNSIKIPVSGGKTYSPDFAYVLNYKNGEKKLHFIVETKNVYDNKSLREEEKQKIKHAEQLFGDTLKIKFKTQFNNDKITKIITNIIKGNK